MEPKDFLNLCDEPDPTAAIEYLENNSFVDPSAYISCRDQALMTPLHYAASQGHLQLVHLLISYGADVNAVDSFNKTAFWRAVSLGQHQIALVPVSYTHLRAHET